MKKIKILLFTAFISFSLISFGQVPQLIDFQGMARDGVGAPLSNITISARMSVYQGPLPGTMEYSELHNPPTDSYGLFHLMIGGGTVLFGDFTTIDWSTGNYFIKTEIDPNGGAAFIDMGMSKMTTSPFAFYAAESGGGSSSLWLPNGGDIYFNTGFVAIGHDSPTDILHINNVGGDAYVRLESPSYTYFLADGVTNSGLAMAEGGTDMAWLYWNPLSQAIFMYENGTQTMAWKQNNVGVGIIDPLVKLQVDVQNSAGVPGADIGNLYSPSQTLSPAVWGFSENNTSDISQGVAGHAYSTTSLYNEGVFGEGGGGTTNNYGVYGVGMGDAGSSYSVAVYAHDQGSASNNYAGIFVGDVDIQGNLSKSGGTFKIDHPQDPANKYLIHSFVESPDMMNIYNGNVTTDASGMANVELPTYFDALNIDFRYQLTVIGTFAQAIIKEEISGNSFVVQTDKPNVKVSWQVTGVRNDVWAQENRVVAEMDKPSLEKGLYLYPELFGKSAEQGLKTGIPHEQHRNYKGSVVKDKDPATEPNQQ